MFQSQSSYERDFSAAFITQILLLLVPLMEKAGSPTVWASLIQSGKFENSICRLPGWDEIVTEPAFNFKTAFTRWQLGVLIPVIGCGGAIILQPPSDAHFYHETRPLTPHLCAFLLTTPLVLIARSWGINGRIEKFEEHKWQVVEDSLCPHHWTWWWAIASNICVFKCFHGFSIYSHTSFPHLCRGFNIFLDSTYPFIIFHCAVVSWTLGHWWNISIASRLVCFRHASLRVHSCVEADDEGRLPKLHSQACHVLGATGTSKHT